MSPRPHAQVFDWSILALPLFDERHRALALKAEQWSDAHRGLPAEMERYPVSERVRRYTRLLGEDGWLAHALGPGPGERPDLRSICLLRQALAFTDDLLDFAFAIQGLSAGAIGRYGSEELRARYLGECRAGTRLGSLALSEPEAGSDLAAIALRAETVADGFVLNGTKTWISNGDIADFHCVLARTGNGPRGMGLSLLAVPARTPGLEAQPIDLLAPRPFASLHFRDCRIPQSALIGRPGLGFPQVMELLDLYRVSVAAAAVGLSRRACHAAVAWSRARTVRGSPLIEAQLTKEKLAGMAVYLDCASLLCARAAWEADTGSQRIGKHASIAKLVATEDGQRVVDSALQLLGAAGLVAGSPTERLYREIRSLRIYEGTSEMQQLIIADAFASEMG